MNNQEIRQRLQFLLPSGLTESEWAAIISKVADFVREEIMRCLPEEEKESDCNCYYCKSDYGNCVTSVRNNYRSQILTKLKERGEV